MNDTVYMIMRIIITIIAMIISSYVIPYVKSLSDNERLKVLYEAVRTSVYAAEQTVKGTGKGTEKKALALQDITKFLNDHGISVTSAQIDSLIEAAVYEMKRGESA